MNDNIRTGDALMVIDVQNDFCPGGALEVRNSNEIIPVLNLWMSRAMDKEVPVYASRDWHPRGHISFTESGGPWPPHCIQDSHGAFFQKDLQLPESTIIVTKGVRFDHDQNSAFDETGLEVKLRRDGIKRLWIGGLAEDVCVLATALDARRHGLEVVLIAEATRPVTDQGRLKAREKMRQAGVEIHEKNG